MHLKTYRLSLRLTSEGIKQTSHVLSGTITCSDAPEYTVPDWGIGLPARRHPTALTLLHNAGWMTASELMRVLLAHAAGMRPPECHSSRPRHPSRYHSPSLPAAQPTAPQSFPPSSPVNSTTILPTQQPRLRRRIYDYLIRVEFVQHIYLMWLAGIRRAVLGITRLWCITASHFGMSSLASQQEQHDILFIRTVRTVRLYVDLSFLLERLPLIVSPRPLRKWMFFHVSWARVNTVLKSSFCSMPKACNALLDRNRGIDVWHHSNSFLKSMWSHICATGRLLVPWSGLKSVLISVVCCLLLCCWLCVCYNRSLRFAQCAK